MNSDSIRCNAYESASGHTRLRATPRYDVQPTNYVPSDSKIDYSSLPQFKCYAGPYKDYNPPGDRTPAVGEKIWGDVPYLPSYLNPMYHEKPPSGPQDNLYCRGPFYKGVSETHSEFINRGILPKRQYHEFKRHYEEPGMKYNKSVTHADFTPPHPMLQRDKNPCLKEESPMPWYEPERKPPKNPHAKELERAKQQEPITVYVDDNEPKRDFSTEHNDNFVCYQKAKTGTKIREPQPVPEEMFLKNLRENHQKCSHSPPPDDDFCDGSCKLQKKCDGAAPKKTSWLMYPKDYSFRNGVMLIPCKCHYDN